MSHDPLPPPDTICGYTRPKSESQPPTDSSNILTTFFRSILPNYNPEDDTNSTRYVWKDIHNHDTTFQVLVYSITEIGGSTWPTHCQRCIFTATGRCICSVPAPYIYSGNLKKIAVAIFWLGGFSYFVRSLYPSHSLIITPSTKTVVTVRVCGHEVQH